MERAECDVLVVGAGPAGLAAAYRAAKAGQRVVVVDDNPDAGGQIWRGEKREPRSREAQDWFERIRSVELQLIAGARVFQQSAPRPRDPRRSTLLAETSRGDVCELMFESLILATGAREQFLPFPGWTLPNVMGAGGLQALVKNGLPISGKKVVVAGTGPLLLPVAAYLRHYGAKVEMIAEQASRGEITRFVTALARHPRKLAQAVGIFGALAGIPYRLGCWPVEAKGDDRLRSVVLLQETKKFEVECDYLACG